MFRSLGLLACFALCVLSGRTQTFSDSNFISEVVHFGNGIVSIDFLPDGTLIAGEKRGVLIALTPDGSGGFNAAVELLSLSDVSFAAERGLLGVAVDPDFSNTGHIFLFYTTSSDQRLVRYTYTGTPPIDPGTATVILSGLPNDTNTHNAGDIEFNPNEPDYLYLATGDDGGFGLAEENGVPLVQLPDNYYGKMLKIDKTTGLGLTTNPFYQGDTSAIRARVWAVGFRNPFRFTFHPEAPNNDVMYVSENGDVSDRLSWVQMGSNGAWSLNGDADFLDPPDPNHRVMAAVPASRVAIIIATQPPFAIDGQPTLYNGKWFPFPAYVDRWHLTGTDLDTLTPLAVDNGGPFVDGYVAVDFVFGPDGHLYVSETFGDASLDDFLSIRRIMFVGGTAPTAQITTSPNPAEGLAPLTVQFTDTSVAGSSAINQWSWDFGNGDTSSDQNPEYTYNVPGNYTVTLRVTQTDGLTDTETVPVTVFANTTINLTGTIFDGGDPSDVGPLQAATTLGFYQEDGTTPIPVPNGTGANQNFIDIASGGQFNLQLSFSVTGDGFVVSAGEAKGDGVSSAKTGFLLPSARGSNDYQFDFYLASSVIAGRTLNMREEPISIDLGAAVDNEGTLLAVAGGRDFDAPLPSTGISHRRESDVMGYFHVPVPDATIGTLLFFDLVGDTGSDQHPSRTAAALSQADTTTEVEWLLGTYAGGRSCDDLSGIAETPDINFLSQIQPIFTNSCTGCHSATSSQNGGLDLTGNATSQLVNQLSNFVPNMPLVTPGNLERSYLFEKINCADTQFGTRMRPSDAMPLADQALIRDWITQLSNSSCQELLMIQVQSWPDTDIRSHALWVTENCQ
jgi:PKD repeat protein